MKAAADTIRLLGNASAQISKLRRKILRAVNPDIQDLAEEDIFEGVAPDLFGKDFESRMKGRAESIKLLGESKPPHPKKKFFHGGRPTAPQRGGSHFSRGGDTGPKRTSTAVPRASDSPEPCYKYCKLLLPEFNKTCIGSKGGCTLNGHYQGIIQLQER